MQRTAGDRWVRGGQATQHWFRMGGQVVGTTIRVGALVFVVTYTILCWRAFDFAGAHMTYAHHLATFFVEARGTPDTLIKSYHLPGVWAELTAEKIYNDLAFADTAATYERQARLFAWYAVIPALVGAVLACALFLFSGRRLEDDSHVRGTQLVSARDLKLWSDRKWKDYRRRFGKSFKSGPQYTVAGIKFPPNAVEAQTAICGTVGSGKTNLMKELTLTIRQNGGRAIIYDRMGSFVRDFYDPATDIIINPFDSRSVAWSPFQEATNPEFFTGLAEVFIPDNPGTNDPFWSQAARIVFDYAAQTIYGQPDPTNAKLRQAILDIPSEQLARLLQATPGRHFFNAEISKTADSIRANLIAELRFLEFLRDDADPFSIRDWVKSDQPGFVFLTSDAEHSAATRNIISAIFEVAANALMTCPESHDPKVWFMMDELPSLNRMPFLPRSLAQIRQFGGAFLVGYQVFSQLEEIYGDKGAKTIAGNLNNRLIFNTPDADTAEIFSKSLGSEDVEENRQSISVGAHETRDGIGIMQQRTERRIVTASQIQSLPQWQGYVRFAYDAPTAFIEIPALDISPKAPKFIRYHGRGFRSGQMSSGATPPRRHDPDTSEDIKASFDTYRQRLVDAGLRIYEDDRYLDVLWAHFAQQISAGLRAQDIGPPSRGVNAPAMVTSPGTSKPSTPPAASSSDEAMPRTPRAHDHGLPSRGDNHVATFNASPIGSTPDAMQPDTPPHSAPPSSLQARPPSQALSSARERKAQHVPVQTSSKPSSEHEAPQDKDAPIPPLQPSLFDGLPEPSLADAMLRLADAGRPKS